MASTGGSVESISLNGRIFAVAGDVEINRKLGGFENEIEMNGDGSARLIKNRIANSLDGVVVSCDDDRADHEYVQELSDGNDFFTIAITYASGITYQGLTQITGELQHSSQKATLTFSTMGPGQLTKQ